MIPQDAAHQSYAYLKINLIIPCSTLAGLVKIKVMCAAVTSVTRHFGWRHQLKTETDGPEGY